MLKICIWYWKVFLESSLLKAEELGKQYDNDNYNDNQFTPKALGIDPGFGSSKTAFTIIEYVDNSIVRVIYSKQFEHSSTEDMANHAYNLIRKYNLNNGNNLTFIDGSQPGFIRSLKIKLSENSNYEYFVERSKKDNVPLYLYMNIVPVNFAERGKIMLGKVVKLLDMNKVAISPDDHAELLTEMRIATADEDLRLDKKEYLMDLLDSLRLAFEFIDNR